VYLVGDFNRWNPTVERMEASGDEFEVRLFLVAGEYRYQFVVDGTWMDDPDNPAGSGRGSPLKLIERSGGMILDTDHSAAAGPVKAARGWLRYIGALRVDDGDGDVAQRVDAEARGSFDRVKARGRVATADSSWTWSPARVDAYFDRGRVDIDFGRLDLRGVDNDSAWASADPMALVGDAGVYGYDAGFRRHGVALVAAGSRAALRAFYADASSQAPRPAAGIPSSALADFAAGAAPDTTVYDYTYTFDDSDLLALEAAASIGDFDLGFTRREERGLNPGVIAVVERETSGFTSTVFATRENRRVANAWLRARRVFGARVTGSFGWGDADANAFASESSSGALPPTLDASAAAEPAARSTPIMDTRRGRVEVDTDLGGANLKVRWDGTRFDFDGVEGASRADVRRVSAEGVVPRGAWRFGAALTYTDADYGGAPDALYIDWPERNPWLSLWDDIDAPSLVGLGLESHDVVTVTAERLTGSILGGGALLVQMRELAGEMEHASARVWARSVFRGAWYARADGRVAWYDDTPARESEVYWDGYLEVGRTWKRVSLDLGAGFDPVVFDPVIGDYADIGRTEFLRGAIAGGVRRSASGALLDGLREREAALDGTATIKLECVIELD
jgi:hypothetical protein